MFIKPITLLVGIVFAPLAAFMAYLITYEEYRRHYPDKHKPRQLALEAAITTLIIFLLISVAIGWFLGGIAK